MLSATPNLRMSTLGFRPAFEACGAIAAGRQSETLPSIVIGYIGPAGFAGPRRGRRRSATLRSGITYSFHRVIASSRWNRADPRPFVNPLPFVSPFVIPRRSAERPFVKPLVRPPAWRPFVSPFVRPTPFVRPRSPFVRPFVRPRTPFVSPFVLPLSPFVSPFVRPLSPFVSPFVRPFRPLVMPFVRPVPPRRDSGSSPFVIPRRPVGSDDAATLGSTHRS